MHTGLQKKIFEKSILLGVCGDESRLPFIEAFGYDYIEMGVKGLVRPFAPEEEFLRHMHALRAKTDIPFYSLCMFVPAELKITGDAVQSSALESYVTTVMTRAQTAGVQKIVFGSGGARSVPVGFDRASAWRQLVNFCRMTAPLAHACGITVTVEPLNKTQCNILNTVDRCAALVREVNHPALRLLADSYHMLLEQDDFQSIREHSDLIEHIHVATAPNRRAPGVEQCDLDDFFSVLYDCDYSGGMSIEADMIHTENDLRTAMAVYMQPRVEAIAGM